MKTRIGYSGAHNRVRRVRGMASGYVCCCGAPAKEWAYDHANPDPDELTNDDGRRYSADPDRYIAMCRRCHRCFDKAHITTCPEGHPYAGSNLIIDQGKRKCRECVYARNRRAQAGGLSHAARQRKTELQRRRRAAQRAIQLAERSAA